MREKVIFCLCVAILIFDSFALYKAKHPQVDENYEKYFIKKDISNEMYYSLEMKSLDSIHEKWRVEPFCKRDNYNRNCG